jgi:hypothetical protein
MLPNVVLPLVVRPATAAGRPTILR